MCLTVIKALTHLVSNELQLSIKFGMPINFVNRISYSSFPCSTYFYKMTDKPIKYSNKHRDSCIETETMRKQDVTMTTDVWNSCQDNDLLPKCFRKIF